MSSSVSSKPVSIGKLVSLLAYVLFTFLILGTVLAFGIFNIVQICIHGISFFPVLFVIGAVLPFIVYKRKRGKESSFAKVYRKFDIIYEFVVIIYFVNAILFQHGSGWDVLWLAVYGISCAEGVIEVFHPGMLEQFHKKAVAL
jgi:hypothetical protein